MNHIQRRLKAIEGWPINMIPSTFDTHLTQIAQDLHCFEAYDR